VIRKGLSWLYKFEYEKNPSPNGTYYLFFSFRFMSWKDIFFFFEIVARKMHDKIYLESINNINCSCSHWGVRFWSMETLAIHMIPLITLFVRSFCDCKVIVRTFKLSNLCDVRSIKATNWIRQTVTLENKYHKHSLTRVLFLNNLWIIYFFIYYYMFYK
jgi:hypothetical protein